MRGIGSAKAYGEIGADLADVAKSAVERWKKEGSKA